MDLYAYSQIEKIGQIAAQNGIVVPRLRGYRLMADEGPIDVDQWCAETHVAFYEAEALCHAYPFWTVDARASEYSGRTDAKEKKYLDSDKYIIKWSNIHGWKRKRLKFAIKKAKAAHKKQFDVWNKYAGDPSVLYIHARIGGGNWPTYCDDVKGQPWFIEKIDDAFDSTYCDIYARIASEVD